MLYINLSFDYELFMGQNYVPEKEVLIDPTDNLCAMLSAENVSGTFFADIYCPMKYRDLGNHSFPELFDNQLQNMIKQGHDVQLHIHPNWLTTTKIGKKVEFDQNFYRIHNWADGDDYSPVKKLVHDGICYINNLIKPIDENYRCVAFRAGGFCLQPEKKLAPILYDEGIRIDSSVCRGMAYSGGGMYYDYKKISKKKNVYISQENSLSDAITSETANSVFEVPIGSYNTFPHRQIAAKLNKKISLKPENGYGMPLPKRKITVFDKTFGRLTRIFTAYNMLTFDFFNSTALIYMLKRIFKEENCKKNDVFIATISHPKALTEEHISGMRKVIREIKKNPYVKFVNMQDIAKIKSL